MACDIFRTSRTEIRKHLLHMQRKLQVCVDSCALDFSRWQVARSAARKGRPRLMPIENRHAIAIWKMHQGSLLVGCFAVNVDRNFAGPKARGALYHAAGDSLQRFFTAQCGDIFIDQICHAWETGKGRFLLLTLWPASRRHVADSRNCRRNTIAAMARVAGHLAVAIEISLIDGSLHLHHLARDTLGLFVVLIEVIFDVAKLAIHPKRRIDELHCGNELIGWNLFEHLNILERVFRSRNRRGSLLRGWCTLRENESSESNNHKKYCERVRPHLRIHESIQTSREKF